MNDELAIWLWAIICAEDSGLGYFALFAEPAWAFRTNSARLAELRSRGFVTSEREPADGGIITWWHPTDAGREVMAAYRKGREDDFPNGLDWVGEEL